MGAIGDFIRGAFPTNINRDDPIFRALIASPEANGTIESVFSELERERKAWYDTDVYHLKGIQLAKVFSALSPIERGLNDTDLVYQLYNDLLFYRSGDTIWGNYHNVLSTFRRFFNSERVYIVNNTDTREANIVSNGDFSQGLEGWDYSNATLDTGDTRFEGDNSVALDSGTLSQSIHMEGGRPYYIHAFIKGDIDIVAQDDMGHYYSPHNYIIQPRDGTRTIDDAPLYRDDGIGAWQESPYIYHYHSDIWHPVSLYVIPEWTSDIKVTFSGIGEVDYIRAYLKTGISSFSLITVFGTTYTSETFTLGPLKEDWSLLDTWPYTTRNEADIALVPREYIDAPKEYIYPEPRKNYTLVSRDGALVIDYAYLSYYDQNYIVGSQSPEATTIYQSLLRLLAPAGVITIAEALECNIDTRIN